MIQLAKERMEVQLGNRDAVVFRDAECRENLKLVRLLATLASWCRRRVLLRESRVVSRDAKCRESLVWSSVMEAATAAKGSGTQICSTLAETCWQQSATSRQNTTEAATPICTYLV